MSNKHTDTRPVHLPDMLGTHAATRSRTGWLTLCGSWFLGSHTPGVDWQPKNAPVTCQRCKLMMPA